MADISTLLSRLAAWPVVNFADFGQVAVKPLSRLQKLTGSFLGRNWVTIPHVTHHDEIDITDLERRRQAWNLEHPETKVTIVILLIKAMVSALIEFPQFNASLSEDGNAVILKKYFNIGMAVDTPNGLLVAVISDCDRKNVGELALEVTSIVAKARSKGLSLAEMSGSSICITSLGHIGGTGFTPIINAPDVAILGVMRTREQPRRGANDEVVWRQMLPLSLSYDHRIINGADAARFLINIGKALNAQSLFDSAVHQVAV
jgi:pyruvate dehydrogenase E2 component (dihydrolipoamide acetyltransferase)